MKVKRTKLVKLNNNNNLSMDTQDKDGNCDIKNINHGEGSKNIEFWNKFILKLLSC